MASLFWWLNLLVRSLRVIEFGLSKACLESGGENIIKVRISNQQGFEMRILTRIFTCSPKAYFFFDSRSISASCIL